MAKSCLTLYDSMDCSTPGFPDFHCLPELTQVPVHWSGDAMQPSQSLHPLLRLPSPFPSIRVFSNELILHIKWPECWSFSFSISPSNDHLGLIPLGLIGLMSLQSRGLSKVFSNTTVQKYQFFSAQLSLWYNSHIHTWLLEKPVQLWLCGSWVSQVTSLMNSNLSF